MQTNSGDSEPKESSSPRENNVGSNNSNDESGNNSGNNAVAPPPPQHAIAATPGQHWVAMQHPAAAMVMQHGMMPMPHSHYVPSHYVPYHHRHHNHPPPMSPQPQGRGSNGAGSNGENRTIWVGDLHGWMDEDYLRNCFASTGEVYSIKVIRNKHTGVPEGYGFVEFASHSAAEQVLQAYSGLAMPNTDHHPFRLNWAAFSMGGDRRSNNSANDSGSSGSGMSIFVGDLAVEVTDALLHETFSGRYPSVKAAKVVIDASTGRSKGYGFVRFGDDAERLKAMTEMNGVYCGSRKMRVGAATPRRASWGYEQHYSAQGGYSNGFSPRSYQPDGDSVNATIFVGGLDPNATDEDLKQPFLKYGEIVSVKIPVGKGCGFVQFANRNDAEEALQELNGTTIGKQTVRLAWGRNPANRQPRVDFENPWTGPYYGPHYFDGLGYTVPSPHEPIVYAPAYGPYPFYGPHHQQVS